MWELAAQQGTILGKAWLYRQVLNRSLGAYDRGLEMHVSRLRKKLNQAGWPGERITTVHGDGYFLQ